MLNNQKNCTEEINSTLDCFRAMPVLHVRPRYSVEDGDMEPGKQGIALRQDCALEEAEAACKMVGTRGGGDN
jgi:Transcriptional Coactivator p15 (PC4)